MSVQYERNHAAIHGAAPGACQVCDMVRAEPAAARVPPPRRRVRVKRRRVMPDGEHEQLDDPWNQPPEA